MAPLTHGPDDGRYAQLLEAVARGRPEAMERLLTDAQALAYRFSVFVCGSRGDAEDAMQDALLQTYRHAQHIRRPQAFRTWLYRTVRNACLMSRRPRARQPPRLLSLDESPADQLAADTPSPEDQSAAAAERRRLAAAFQALPRPYRDVAFLRDVEELSARDVAGILGISEANVKQRLHRARVMLRRALS
jgi:RNA polymerase sigma factor (sigma-70 family)